MAYETVLRELRRRDEIDSTRSVSPLKKADDAVYLDSTNKDVENVMAEVKEIVKRKQPTNAR